MTQFAPPLKGGKFVIPTGYFNFSCVLQVNRNPKENELHSHVGWIICSLETGLKRDILQGANCPGNVICIFRYII